MKINVFFFQQWHREEDRSVWIRRFWVHQSSFDVCRRMCLILIFQLCILLVLPFNAWINLLPPGIQWTILYFSPTKKHSISSIIGCESQFITSNCEKENETSFQTVSTLNSIGNPAAYWWVMKLSFCLKKLLTTAFKQRIRSIKAPGGIIS